MTEKLTNPLPAKSATQTLFEYTLLAVCLSVIALRATLSESPGTAWLAAGGYLSESLLSLTMSTILIFLFLAFLGWIFLRSKISFRLTGLETGLPVFLLAGLVSGLYACDKRAAITDFVVLLAPVLMAVILVQVLDTDLKVRLVLAVIAASGVVSAYQCVEQFFVSNRLLIEQYQKSPQSLLEPLGIRAGSFENMLFEHRLGSTGAHGFFTTANSAGSFAILALFAGLALAPGGTLKTVFSKLFNRKSGPPLPQPALAGLCAWLAVIFFVIFGLVLTCSKGAIAACLLAVVTLISYTIFSDWMRGHRKLLIAAVIIVFVIGILLTVWYGTSYNRLPGGNSMLVRWQYWQAAARMYADRPLTGVGGGNFVHFYPRYKQPDAIETVSDPHNFPLSILTQYGPAGLLGFLLLLLVPLLQTVFPTSGTAPQFQPPSLSPNRLFFVFSAIIAACLLIVRPLIMPSADSDGLDVRIYIFVTSYLAPVLTFLAAMFLLTAWPAGRLQGISGKPAPAAVFCGICGFCLHNLVDFAIFEPGISTAFWALLAALVSIRLNRGKITPAVRQLPIPARFASVALTIFGILIYFSFAFLPAALSSVYVRSANNLSPRGLSQEAHKLLTAAAERDKLNALPPALQSKLYLQDFHGSQMPDLSILQQAEKSCLEAISRNRADFKNFERLTDIYNLLAEHSAPSTKTQWQDKAFAAAQQAVVLYPGCERLHITLAQAAEMQGKLDIAIEHYRQALDIDRQFRCRFKQMYPRRPVISRLSDEKLELACRRLDVLTKTPQDFPAPAH